MSGKQSGGVLGLGVVLILFAVMWAQTGGFSSSPVASSDVTTRDATPTVNDDIDRGFLPGYVWVDQSGPGIYGLVSGADGAADWNQLDAAGGGTHPVDLTSDVTGGLPSTNILDGTILEVDLKAVDSAADEECLTFEVTTGDFEWQSCAAGGTHPVDVTSDITGIVPIASGGTGQVTATEDGILIGDTSAFIVKVLPDCQDSSGNHLNYNNTTDAFACGTSVRAIDISDDTNLAAGSGITLTGDSLSIDVVDVSSGTNLTVTSGIVLTLDELSAVITTTQITDGTILEPDLKVVDSPADEECLTYEATGGDFEWQTCGGGSAIAQGRFADAGDDYLTLPGVNMTGANATLALVADRMLFFPIIADTAITLDRMVIDVTAAGAGGTTARICVWEANTDWQPGTLLFDAGTVSVASIAVVAADMSPDEAMPAGRYLIGLVSDGTPTLKVVGGTVEGQGLVESTFTNVYRLLITGQGAQHSGGCSDPGTDWDTVFSTSLATRYYVLTDVITP